MGQKARNRIWAFCSVSNPLGGSLPVSDLGLLLLIPMDLLLLPIVLLGELLSVKTDLVPGEVKELINRLKTSSSSLGNKYPNPESTQNTDDGEEVEGSVRGETQRWLEKHIGQRAVGRVLADEMHRHGDGGANGSNAKGEELR